MQKNDRNRRARGKPRLLFVSPRFLFPADSGGKIRTSQILRGMKGGRFELTLVSPATDGALNKHAAEVNAVCDHFLSWPETHRGNLQRFYRLRHLPSGLPIPVATDRVTAGVQRVSDELAKDPDVAVFDFPHAAVLAPREMTVPTVLFTHNVEAEIFRRHVQVSSNPLKRMIWRNQLRKMERFEQTVLQRFDAVVAVSERDKAVFEQAYGIGDVALIRTGVDLDYFRFNRPGGAGKVVFIGSMDWLANIDGIEYFMEQIWPRVRERRPDATMTVVGRSPPASLTEKAQARGLRWRFTGFVEDVRPYVHGASLCVIPLRVGGGTRIKAYEAMAMGCPVVSTSIGVEGLPVDDGQHYLRADDPTDFAGAVLRLLDDGELRDSLSRQARDYVATNFSHRLAARDFEGICWNVREKYRVAL